MLPTYLFCIPKQILRAQSNPSLNLHPVRNMNADSRWACLKNPHMPKKTGDSMAPSSNRNRKKTFWKIKPSHSYFQVLREVWVQQKPGELYVKWHLGELHCIPALPPTCHHSVQTLLLPRCRLGSHHYQVKFIITKQLNIYSEWRHHHTLANTSKVCHTHTKKK